MIGAQGYTQARRWLAAILTIYLLLGGVYAATTPIFEKPDENWHFFTVLHIKEQRRLPVVTADPEQPFGQEGAQAPLYYLLSALAVSPLDTSQAPGLLRENPQANKGDPANPGNKNVFIHPVSQSFDRLDWRNSILALYVARAVALLAGLLAVWGTFALARELLPETPHLWLAASALLAFTPQWLFISSAVANDSSITAFSALTLWLTVRVVKRTESLRVYAALGTCLGLGLLSKSSGLLLVVAVGLALGTAYILRRPIRIRGVLLLSGIALLLAGWWYARNLILYHDLTGTAVFRSLMGQRAAPPATIQEWLAEWRGIRWSYWGVFGWFNLIWPPWVYAGLDALTGLGLAGLLPGIRQPRDRWLLSGLGAWVMINLLALVAWTLYTEGSQGRLIFSAAPAIAVLLTRGWSQISRRRTWLPWLMPVALLLLAWVSPFTLIVPAYARPQPIEAGDIPPAALRPDLVFGTDIHLVAVEVRPASVRPGEEATLTLYWQTVQPQTRDLLLNLRLLGRDYQPVAGDNTYPGWGTWPVDLWKPGVIYRDVYRLPVSVEAETPVLARWVVWFEDMETGESLAATSTRGIPLDPLAGMAFTRIPPISPASSPQFETDVRFDDFARLTGASISRAPEGFELKLYWEGLAPAPEDFTVFIHLLASDGTFVAAADGPPFDGFYPTTVWAAGDRMVDSHPLPEDLPPGRYTFAVGLYRLADGVRASARGGGMALENGMVYLPLEYQVPAAP